MRIAMVGSHGTGKKEPGIILIFHAVIAIIPKTLEMYPSG
jgi:hypothetical protein